VWSNGTNWTVIGKKMSISGTPVSYTLTPTQRTRSVLITTPFGQDYGMSIYREVQSLAAPRDWPEEHQPLDKVGAATGKAAGRDCAPRMGDNRNLRHTMMVADEARSPLDLLASRFGPTEDVLGSPPLSGASVLRPRGWSRLCLFSWHRRPGSQFRTRA
jgi:hypothetical protein